MTYTEIKDLLSSGFTPEQITQLTTSGVNPSAPESPSGGEPITPTGEVTSPAEVGEAVVTSPSPTEGETNNPDPDPLEDIRSQLQQLQQENKQLREQIQHDLSSDKGLLVQHHQFLILALFKVIQGRTVAHDAGSIGRNLIQKFQHSLQGPAGGDGKPAAFRHKIFDCVDVALGNGGVRRGKRPVKVHRKQNVGKKSHDYSPIFSSFSMTS